MATTVSVCSWTSAILLALTGPALAQSQGDTGAGTTLEQAQEGLEEINDQLRELWRGEPGKYAKYGIGAAGVAAALALANRAVNEPFAGRVNLRSGKKKAGGPADDDTTSPTATSTSTTTSTD